MATFAPLQGHFDGGEISPLVYGRVDAERYKASLALCKNWIPTLQGGLIRRPGTAYVGTVKDSTQKTRLIPFSFSTTQSYILEFGFTGGAGYIRFYANYGQVQSGGVAYEIAHPYTAAELFQIRYVQSADTLYLVHPNHPPMKLERFGATNWQLANIAFQDGPYLTVQSVNNQLFNMFLGGQTGIQQLSVGGALGISNCANNGSGVIRVTVGSTALLESGQSYVIANVTGTTEANGTWRIAVINATQFDLIGSTFVNAYVNNGIVCPALFASTDVGRLVRFEVSGVWAWGAIVSYASATSVNVYIQGTVSGAGIVSPTAFALGAWSTTTGFPGTATFHEDRLCFAGPTSFPQRLDASNVSNYENFAPTKSDGTVQSNNALSFNLNANDVNLIQWLSSDEKGLLGGALAAEWSIRPSVQSEAITPTNVNAVRTTRWGSTSVPAVHVGRSTMFIQTGGRKLRELNYYWDIDGYRATDLTELAEHITGTGVVDLAYQRIPLPIVWLVRNDGALVGMSYDRDMTQLRTGWHWHLLGGQSDAAGSPPVVESIAVIPDPTGVKDDLWMVVKRWVNGAQVRYIEYLTKIFESIDLQQYAFHADCGNTYDSPVTITNLVINGTAATVTAPSHGLTTGVTVRFDNVVGALNGVGGPSYVNGKIFVITVVDMNTFTLNGLVSTTATAYVSGGQTRKLVTTISGLTYLSNETVYAYADGAVQGPLTVNFAGQLTLSTPAAVVTIGYGYNSDGQMLRLEAGARNGTSLGKTRRIQRAGFMLYRSQGLQVGSNFSGLDTVQFRVSGVDPSGQATSLFTGILTHEMEFDYDLDNQIAFRVSSPLPCTLLAVMPLMQTQDRA